MKMRTIEIIQAGSMGGGIIHVFAKIHAVPDCGVQLVKAISDPWLVEYGD